LSAAGQLTAEQRTRALQAIASLNERDRAAFLLHRFDGMPYSAVALFLACTVKDVEQAQLRALRALTPILDGAR